MPRSLLPPRGIFAGTSILFNRDLSAPVKETLLQVMALSWGSDSHTTPPLTYTLLEHLTGKNARTLRGHLAELRSYQAVLRLQPAGSGQFFLILADWLFGSTQGSADAPPADLKTAARGGKVLPQPVKEDDDLILNDFDQQEQEESDSNPVKNVLPLNDQSGRAAKRAAPTRRGAAKKPLSGAVEKRLREAGVFPSLLPEVAARAAEYAFKDKDLLALLDWCLADQPERPAGLFVGRLRAGGRAPAEFYTPPCPRCGQRGKHSQECPHRYALPEGYGG
jgi:hypothetical protein